MKKILIAVLFACALSFSVMAQEKMEMNHGNDRSKDLITTETFIKRGAAFSKDAQKISLADALKEPSKYAGKSVLVEGVIVRSCKMEGCWMELAPSVAKDAKSVRVQMKDHQFFIPLNAAGFNAKAEGIIEVKTLSKAEVEHLINEDGAKFDNRNADGTVTEISFLASGVELTKK